ncbi:YDR341C and MSR1 (YHR091C) [Zygosaccharomyces parabailii]|uniref:arginine--tRNA ligase n=1 Tax=Zygosaccharomyces bailii (strain CLIB 213 / ATCC 58445 / CBS 680 / BCRC 21525 / NBRC 1098 / NCYC 1416 / NRRL Y-2227) TaxID=1333698 RepID=A0A8J2T3V9_ZYGB2|nr:YDR341C and MSR1 (YHR091C) [Zygosaccharomyces parabailii]CDF87294.1 BN860_03136g1_1 [Zygosaccharomyces bailii CLIB 213]CDH15639.1 probable Arginine--tRNA ligase, cytoplasmic [Zygosaccharomyces bailii ISA1307]
MFKRITNPLLSILSSSRASSIRSFENVRLFKISRTGFQSRMSNSFTQHLQKLSIQDPPVLEGSHPDVNVVDLMRNYIAQELAKISGVDAAAIYPALEWTNTLDRGDLLIPVPRLVRQKGINPKAIAEEWAQKFPTGELVGEVESNGPFVQFFFNPQFLFHTVVPDILTRKEEYGACKFVENKKVLIEFSSPNIAKPFHAGHLRSTIIGGFLANLYEKCGWEVIRMNYLGDWGKQFGVLAVGYERYGNEKQLAEDPINHLFEVYVRINKDIEAEGGSLPESESTDGKARQYFKRMEDGEPKALALWRKFRDLSIERYIGTYARLNINYDVYSGESQVSKESMDKALKLYDEKNLVHMDRGAKLIDLTKFNKKLGKVIVQKSDGTTLYLTRDVGAAMDRYNKYHFDKMIYVIASQQDLHTAQFFEILKQLGFEWAKNLHHVNFGMVQGMSTRKGTVVFLDNILEETKDNMHEVMKKNEVKYAQVENPDEVADLVGISAVMIQDMQGKRINNYEFKWERMLSFEGDTGPYLQYAHSRLRSMERNVPDITVEDMKKADFSLLTEPAAVALVRLLSQYPDVLRNALKTHEPTTVVTYLFKLTHQVSSCYDVLWVAGQSKELATVRLALYAAARQVLYNGMKLLGLTPVERM